MKRSRQLLVTTIALAAVLTACQVILGIEREPGALLGDELPADTGPDAVPAKPTCVFARPPPPPGPQGAVKPLDTLFFGVREFSFKKTAALRGYDLDSFCTGEDASPNGSPCKRGKAQVNDEDGGVDNASASVQLFAADLPSMNLNSQVTKGSFTVLIQLTEYNGLPDDDLVNVAFISGNGRTAGADCTGEPLTDAATGECPVSWDYPAAEMPLRPGQPFLKGWVKDGLLVARTTGQLVFGLGQATLALSGGIVSAKLVPHDGTWSLIDGFITGRVPVSNLLGVVGAFVIDGLGGRVCGPESTVGPLARDSICAARDLMATQDAEPTEAQCDGLSFVLGFDAVRARTGGPKAIPTVDACPDDYLRCPE